MHKNKNRPKGTVLFCVRTTKKIFLPFLRINSNSRINSNHPQSGYLYFFTIHYYLLPNRQVSKDKSEKWRVNSEKVKSTSLCRNLSIFGGGRWIRTTEVSDNRFTVCPLWPLGNSPILLFGFAVGVLELVKGVEPPTYWLQISCSAIELHQHLAHASEV